MVTMGLRKKSLKKQQIFQRFLLNFKKKHKTNFNFGTNLNFESNFHFGSENIYHWLTY
jgi:hypothetical protein